MLGLIGIAGTPRKAIVLQTRKGTSVTNEQALDPPSLRERQVFMRLLAGHPNWVLRKDACGFYNCAGHAWASRRTAIYDDAEWRKILRDDGYRMAQGNDVRLGDLAIYSVKPDATFLHVGVVCEFRQVTPGEVRIPWVLSKWNDASGEVLHHFNDPPFDPGQLPYEVSFWTERP